MFGLARSVFKSWVDAARREALGAETGRGAGHHSAAPDPVSLLSKRENEVYSFLVAGMRPKDIAQLLVISPKTVDTYRANIMRKLQLDGIAGLVRFAIERNTNSTTLPC